MPTETPRVAGAVILGTLLVVWVATKLDAGIPFLWVGLLVALLLSAKQIKR